MRLVLLLCSLTLVACFKPGGGGSQHTPPESVGRGVLIPIQLQLSAVNAEGIMSKRMTSIQCHYRLSGAHEFVSVPMDVTDIDSKHVVANCTLPALPLDAVGTLDYYFTFNFDRRLSQHKSPTNPIRVPVR